MLCRRRSPRNERRLFRFLMLPALPPFNSYINSCHVEKCPPAFQVTHCKTHRPDTPRGGVPGSEWALRALSSRVSVSASSLRRRWGTGTRLDADLLEGVQHKKIHGRAEWRCCVGPTIDYPRYLRGADLCMKNEGCRRRPN